MKPAWPALMLLSASCITGSYNRVAVGEPIDSRVLEQLRPGVHTLAICLDLLGAPDHVFESSLADDGGSGMALLWFWRDQSGFGLSLSSGDDRAPASISFDGRTTELPGCMLWFDRNLVLESFGLGLVGQLVAGRRRPA